MLDNIFGIATPAKWMCYSNAKLAITLFSLTYGLPLSSKLRNSAYINDRIPGRAIFMDTSRL